MKFPRRLLPYFTAVSLMTSFGSAISGPEQKSSPRPSSSDCSTIYVVDNQTGQVLENKNGDIPFGLASLTKLFIVAGAQIALREEGGFEKHTITFGAPKDLTASQILHYESCTPHVFKGKDVTNITLNIPDAIRSQMTVSANPVSYQLWDRLRSFFQIDTLDDLVQKIKPYAKIPKNSVSPSGNDSSGMNSAKRCNPNAKTPEERNDHKATAGAIARIFNFITDLFTPEDIRILSEHHQKIGPLTASNTSPYLGYRGLSPQGKTGTVTGIAAGVFRVQKMDGIYPDYTFVLNCTTSHARKMAGQNLIDRYSFGIRPLDFSTVNSNSLGKSTSTQTPSYAPPSPSGHF